MTRGPARRGGRGWQHRRQPPTVELGRHHQQPCPEDLGMGDDPLLQVVPLAQPFLGERRRDQRLRLCASGGEELHRCSLRLYRPGLWRRQPASAVVHGHPSRIVLSMWLVCDVRDHGPADREPLLHPRFPQHQKTREGPFQARRSTAW